jgi:nucleoside-diphosphate-sugar epimerase
MRDKLPAEATPATVLVTGSAGFISGYLVQELLDRGHKVLGVDNFSKYGPVERSYQSHPNYKFVEGDAKDVGLLTELAMQCDHALAAAARIGGISYFHAYAYDLIAENERILAATFDAAIRAFREGHLKKITVLSSSMVFENATVFPTPEEHVKVCPPPSSTYGFQKLAAEYFAKGAHEQYGLPYTICRPFNCVGVGERRALGDRDIASGNVKLAMSHVVPDLVQKVLKGQDPLRILGDGNQVRCYTYGGDLARGICTAMFHPAALNDDFNLSTPKSTTVLELAELIWHKVHAALGSQKPFRYESDEPFTYDVQLRVPDVSKAERVLGFRAETSLDTALDEVIPWIRQELEKGRI